MNDTHRTSDPCVHGSGHRIRPRWTVLRRGVRRGVAATMIGISGLAVNSSMSTIANAAGKTTTTTVVAKLSKSGIDPNAPEVLSPGDIPDNIAFVPFRPIGGDYSVTTPEGWSRKTVDHAVEFTDKYNIIRIESVPSAASPTVGLAKAAVISTFGRSKGFAVLKSATVKRKAGSAVVVTYVLNSAPNEVTGKTIPVVVERYEFHRNKTSVVLTLSGAKGADNVDPWRIVTDSFTWT